LPNGAFLRLSDEGMVVTLTLQELKDRISREYGNDPQVVLEALEISVEDLMDTFEDSLIKFRYRFDDLED